MISQVKQLMIKAGEMMVSSPQAKVFEKEGHGNFVTQMDKDVQSFLMEGLGKLYPDVAFFAEEKENDPMGEGKYFVIDPIDGTMNYMLKRQASAVSVALVEKREPVWGLVYDPYKKVMYQGIKGEGAYANGEKIKVGNRAFEKALTAFGTAPYESDLAEKTMAIALGFLRETADLRRVGAATLDFCDLATGKSDVFFELVLSPWDFAAGALIAAEAGAIVSQTNGEPLLYDRPTSLLAASPTCYQGALAIFAKTEGK